MWSTYMYKLIHTVEEGHKEYEDWIPNKDKIKSPGVPMHRGVGPIQNNVLDTLLRYRKEYLKT